MDGVKHFKQGNRQKRFDAQRKHGGLGGHTETKKSKFWSARFNTLHQHNLNNRPNKKRTGVLETAGNPRASCKGHWNAVQKAVYIERPVKAARRSASKFENQCDKTMGSFRCRVYNGHDNAPTFTSIMILDAR